jgi:hypothetical protein
MISKMRIKSEGTTVGQQDCTDTLLAETAVPHPVTGPDTEPIPSWQRNVS